MMSALCLSRKISHKENIADKIMGFLYKFYDPIIRWAVGSWQVSVNGKQPILAQKSRVLIVGFSIFLFIISLFVFSKLGGEFIPELNEGDFAVETILHTNASLSHSIKINNEAQKIMLREYPDEVLQVVSRIGASEIPTDPMGLNSCDLIIDLKNPSEWKKAGNMEELAEKMKKSLSALPGVSFEFTQPIQMRFNELIAGVKSDIAIKIYGDDLGILYDKAQEIAKKIRKIKGIADLKVQQIEAIPQMVVTYNRQKIAQYGLKINELNTLLKAAFAGEKAGVVYEGEKRFDLVIRLDSTYRQDIQQVRDLYLDLPNGGKVPFSEVADINYQDTPSEIARENTRRRISIGINVRNRDVESLVGEIQGIIDENIKLPVGYSVGYGGAFENLKAAKDRLSIAVPVALFLIFVLLYFTFNSVIEALMVFVAIPLSAIGGIWALWLRDMPFSVSAGIGFIALFGVAVLNGIVLIAQFNLLEKEGVTDIKQRILEGTKTRFRPVIMTASVASLGFLPMALSNSAGAEVQRPLATVVIGGLISATLLTLIVLPVIYSFIKGKKEIKIGKPISIILILLLVSFLGKSQTKNLNYCISQVIENNQNLAISKLQIIENQLLTRTSHDVPKTNFDVQYGRTQVFNSNDITFGFGQNFALPSLYKAQEKVLKGNVLTTEKRAILTKNQLISEVKNIYFSILNNTEYIKLLERQDSLYQIAFRAASVRYKTGESNLLEKVSSETRMREIQNRIQSLQADIQGLYQNLKFLMNTTDNFTIDKTFPVKKLLVISELNVLSNPFLAILKQQNEVSILQTKLEKERLKPDFKVGIINQSIEQNYNQNVVQVGINLPIFTKVQNARIEASKINSQIVQQQIKLTENQLKMQLTSLKIQYEKGEKSLDYYEKFALPQVELIIKTATKSYQAGEIEYIEFTQNITQAWQIKESYLFELQTFNQIIINIETIIGNENSY